MSILDAMRKKQANGILSKPFVYHWMLLLVTLSTKHPFFCCASRHVVSGPSTVPSRAVSVQAIGAPQQQS